MDTIYDVAIVGGGPCGYTAALYCVRAGLSALVLESTGPGGQLATTDRVENYPGFVEGINGFELADRMKKTAEGFGAKTLRATVTGLDPAGPVKRIRQDGGETLAKAVILAAGAAPRELGLADEKRLTGRGVSYCATCDGMFYKGKTAAVVGGGNSAAEEALVLSKLCRRVFLIHRRDTLRASKSYLGPLERADNVTFLWDTQVTGLQGEERLTALSLRRRDGEESVLPADGLFVAIGRKPNTAWLQGLLPLDDQGYVIADETTRTKLPGIFAAGDMRTKPLRQIVTAAADGAVAAKFAESYLSGQEGL